MLWQILETYSVLLSSLKDHGEKMYVYSTFLFVFFSILVI